MEHNKRVMIGLEIPQEIKDKLEEEAREKEMSLSGLIRLLIKEHLKTK